MPRSDDNKGVSIRLPAGSAEKLVDAYVAQEPQQIIQLASLLDPNYFRSCWKGFDGELFEDFVGDLLTSAEFCVERSGVGPDGGVDIIAIERISYGANESEDLVWAVQCKFKTDPNDTVTPSEIGDVLNTISDKRFESQKIAGYMLVTNGRLSTNTEGQLRGLPKRIPSIRVSIMDRAVLIGFMYRHLSVCQRYFAI